MNKAMKAGFGKAKRFYQGGLATPSTSLPVPEEGTGLKKETFKEAFRRARRDKQPDFEYNGETFSTEYKEEKAAREAKEKAKEDAEERRMLDQGNKYRADKAKQSQKPAPKPAPKQVDEAQNKPVPFMKRPIKPEYTKEVNDALTMALQGGVLSKEIPKAMGYLRAPKNVAERIEPVLTYKKGGEVKKRTTAFRGDGCAIRGKTKGQVY
jgi:hypothetical protein